MLKKIALAATAATFLAGCTTDPYTGEQKVSNTASGAGIGAAVGALGGLMVGGSSTAQR
ncbi:MAG: cell envelope biogenesis protein OmpA, partial [Brucellaceae bacterium]|nr:cell envelope biogenesis protein OmpA [Brucellaceae bacterium]